jgi:hypothetical protein
MRVRVRDTLGGLGPAAVGALATHAVVYRSFWPADGVHGYFGWYEPAVAAASLAAVVGLAGALVVAVGARRAGRRVPWLRVSETVPLGLLTRRYASGSLLFLLVQESVERTVATGSPGVPQFAPSQWLALVAGIAVVSLLVALLVRAGEIVVRRVLAGATRRSDRRRSSAGWSILAPPTRRSNPLAERFGLRAPPLLAS